MKKNLLYFILIFIFIVLIKFFNSSYILNYKLNNHNIYIKYKSNRTYYEIDKKYNFDIYGKRSLKYNKILDIKETVFDDYQCIIPKLYKYKSYPLCSYKGEVIDYNLIDNESINKYKNVKTKHEKDQSTFKYFKTLDSKTYVAIWNYKGYYILNKDKSVNKELFVNDKYDNFLSYMIEDTIYMPNYDSEYEFNEIVSFNIKTLKKDIINVKYNISFDSYVVGNIKNKLYIFDNKNEVLYEINLKNKKIVIKANNEIGYVKYYNDKFITCSKREYKIDKIDYNKNLKSLYKYKQENNKIYKFIKENKNIKQLILNNKAQIVKEYKNEIYYILDGYLYKYSPVLGSEEIVYYNELNFNDNTIFIYNE